MDKAVSGLGFDLRFGPADSPTWRFRPLSFKGSVSAFGFQGVGFEASSISGFGPYRVWALEFGP